MLVPDEVRKCVVFLAYDSPADGEVLAGTAFFLMLQEEGLPFGYLVTAAHVIEGMKTKGFGDKISGAERGHPRGENKGRNWSGRRGVCRRSVHQAFWPEEKHSDHPDREYSRDAGGTNRHVQ